MAEEFSDFLRSHDTVSRLASDGRPYSVAQLVAHNAAFDGAFLQARYKQLGMFLPARYQVLCSMQRAIWHFEENGGSPTNFKLATLCQYFDVLFQASNAHNALADVAATLLLCPPLREEAASRLEASSITPQPLLATRRTA